MLYVDMLPVVIAWGFTYWPNSVKDSGFLKMEKGLGEHSSLSVLIPHALFSAEATFVGGGGMKKFC